MLSLNSAFLPLCAPQIRRPVSVGGEGFRPTVERKPVWCLASLAYCEKRNAGTSDPKHAGNRGDV